MHGGQSGKPTWVSGMHEKISKMWSTHVVKYSVLKGENHGRARAWVNLKDVLLSEINQAPEDAVQLPFWKSQHLSDLQGQEIGWSDPQGQEVR